MPLLGNISKLYEAVVAFSRNNVHLRMVIFLVLSIDVVEGSAS